MWTSIKQVVDDSLRVFDYSDLALEGTNLTYICSSEDLLLTGPSTATCMGNAQWDPDLRKLIAKVFYT